MSTNKKKKKKTRRFTNRHGVILIAFLAVVILVVNLIVYSYSWFAPSEETGKGLSIEENLNLRSENCTFETYWGEIVTEDMVNHNAPYNTEAAIQKYKNYYIDQIRYEDTPIADDVVITIPHATMDGDTLIPGRVYFRTNIQNQDTLNSSVVSLYHHEMPAGLYVAVTYPTNTYFGNDVAWPDYFIIRNAYVKVKDMNDADGPGLLPVEWFVENRDTETDKYIRVTTQTVDGGHDIEWLYLMYN